MKRFGGQVQAQINDTKAKIGQWSQADFDRHMHEGEAIQAALAEAMADELPADSADVRGLVRRLHDWVGRGRNRTPSGDTFKRLAVSMPSTRTSTRDTKAAAPD